MEVSSKKEIENEPVRVKRPIPKRLIADMSAEAMQVLTDLGLG